MPAKRTVLIIDDDVALSDILRDVLESGGYEVWCCDNGEFALELSKGTCFDVIFADYHMPGMNGADTARRLRIRCPGSLIIGMSAGHMDRDFIDAGADAFFNKLFLFREILAIIHERLASGPNLPER